MKRFLAIMAAVSLLGFTAHAQELVTSVNVVGYYQVEVPANGFALTAMNFQDVGGAGTRAIQDIFAEGSLVGGFGAASADQIRTWDAVLQQYVIYFLFESGGVLPAFDGQWFKIVGGVPEGAPTTDRIGNGQGVWIINNQTNDALATLLGEVVDVETNVTALVEGLNLVAFPFTSSVVINDTTLADVGTGGFGAASADQIRTWDAVLQAYVTYFLFDSGGVLPAFDGKWFKIVAGVPEAAPTTDVLDLGQGAFYSNSDTNQISWEELNPYLGNL